MRELLIATGNSGKFAEIQHFFKDLPFRLFSQKDIFPEGIEIDEPAATFEGNAIIKAMMIGRLSGKLTLADDSGLEVDALDGAPGVKSARYVPGSDEDRLRKLLEVMQDVPVGMRGGVMRCVIAIYDPLNEKIRTCDGSMKLSITQEPSGELGFGYDRILFNEEAGKMHSEETPEDRNRTSHRGKALAKAKEILLKEFA
jgi:XTP/dITP diphosphohydrolase